MDRGGKGVKKSRHFVAVIYGSPFSLVTRCDRLLSQAIAMTGSDLCSISKEWDSQVDTAYVIYNEFYEQVKYVVCHTSLHPKRALQ